MNNNIEEAYCSLGISKILRDKGFQIYCQRSFNPSTNKPQSSPSDNTIPAIARPTHAVAMEWIRINFGKFISITTDDNHQFRFEILSRFNSPQEGVEEALLYVLKNLV